MVVITGKLVVLRQLSTDQEKALVLKWRNSDRIRVNMYNSDIIGMDEHELWMEGALKDRTKLYFVAYDRTGDRPIGVVNLVNIDMDLSHAEWAFYVGNDEYLNTGHAIEMEALLLGYVFEELKLHRLACAVLDFNDKVVSFHKQFGFVEEGRLREYLHRDGRWVDSVLLGILESEYMAEKEKVARIVEKLASRKGPGARN